MDNLQQPATLGKEDRARTPDDVVRAPQSFRSVGAGDLHCDLFCTLSGLDGADFGGRNRHDFLLLTVLAVGCTLLPFALSLLALRHLSAFTTQLAVNLEPVYTVLIAAVLLSEVQELTGTFYLGALVMISTVFIHGRWLSR